MRKVLMRYNKKIYLLTIYLSMATSLYDHLYSLDYTRVAATL